MAIMGILAAVAIPAFRRYQRRAEVGVLRSTLNTIGKGAAACLTLNGRDACQTLRNINVTCAAMTTCAPSTSPAMTPLCFQVSRPNAQSPTSQGCVSIALETGIPTANQLVIGDDLPCVSVTPNLSCSVGVSSSVVSTNACPTECTYRADGGTGTAASCSAGTSSTAGDLTAADADCGDTGNYSADATNLPSCDNTTGICG